jgi:hypothetical protein
VDYTTIGDLALGLSTSLPSLGDFGSIEEIYFFWVGLPILFLTSLSLVMMSFSG